MGHILHIFIILQALSNVYFVHERVHPHAVAIWDFQGKSKSYNNISCHTNQLLLLLLITIVYNINQPTSNDGCHFWRRQYLSSSVAHLQN